MAPGLSWSDILGMLSALIILAIPISVAQVLDHRDKQKSLRLARAIKEEETRFLAQGDIFSFQFKRLERYESSRYWSNDGLVAFLRTEDQLRELCQQDICLRNEKSIAYDKFSRKSTHFKKKAWTLRREWNRLKRKTIERVDNLKDGFETWRANPRWYMHRTLVDDCIQRGGCCARECGCCTSLDRETSLVGKYGVGHCTSSCGCCFESRGFKIGTKTRTKMEIEFGFSEIAKARLKEFAGIHDRIYLASIWGIGEEGTENPSDLIVYPEGEGESEASFTSEETDLDVYLSSRAQKDYLTWVDSESDSTV
ncbi:hypothetical protein N7456_012304 [Penicillium angulare]|uniref:Uncharacterized protein n=1 Tax=Penicillium angulare TaxID=116970 RepID=A0A9W9EVE8_9EURO|nr:hypothetical protein N7456_012304 [Penicillium angulare]